MAREGGGISVAAAKAVDECEQAAFYRDEVFDFWRDEPGEKARLAPQAVGMLWSPFLSVEADEAGQQGLSDTAQRWVEPAFVIALYALALGGAFLAPRHFVALAALLLGLNTLMAMVFAGTVRYRAPWDFVLALLAAFALERAWELLRAGARRTVPAQLGRAPRSGRCSGPARTPRAHARARPTPSRLRARVAREPEDRRRERIDVTRGHEEPAAAVLDDLGEPAHVARDHGSATLHRLERDHAEPLAERRHDDDLRVLEDRRGRRDATEERDRALEPELADRRPKLGLERPVARDPQRDVRKLARGPPRKRAAATSCPLIGIRRPTTASRGCSRQRRRLGPGSIP